MRLVAVHAGRKNMHLFFPQFTFDDLPVHLFDHSVAFSTGSGDVFTGD
jgi:hypothetical protein